MWVGRDGAAAPLVRIPPRWRNELIVGVLEENSRLETTATVGVCVSSVALTKHHKLDGLKQQECILSQLWRPQSETKAWVGLCSSEEYEGESVLDLHAHTGSVRGSSPCFVDCVLTIFTSYSLCVGLSLCLYFLLL